MIIIIFILFLFAFLYFLIHIYWIISFGKKRTDCEKKQIGDMYEYYDAADGNPLVIFTWVPLANIFILLAGFIIFFINLMSNIKIR